MLDQVNFRISAEGVRREVEEKLNSLGILFRVFSRGKDARSLQNKISKEPGKYTIGKRLIQDCIGIRIVLYFPQDIKTVEKVLCKSYSLKAADSTVDAHKTNQFSVTRYNLIFDLPDHHLSEVNRFQSRLPIDKTFEVQIRTMLSEGWHEVEHDLRYKCQDHWKDEHDLSRALNGIMATVETAEWSMNKIFDDLSYRHYKNRNWSAMLHTKLRMRMAPIISEEINAIINADAQLAKDLYRIERSFIIEKYSDKDISSKIPITLNNIVFLYNKFVIKHQYLTEISPTLINEL